MSVVAAESHKECVPSKPALRPGREPSAAHGWVVKNTFLEYVSTSLERTWCEPSRRRYRSLPSVLRSEPERSDHLFGVRGLSTASWCSGEEESSCLSTPRIVEHAPSDSDTTVDLSPCKLPADVSTPDVTPSQTHWPAGNRQTYRAYRPLEPDTTTFMLNVPKTWTRNLVEQHLVGRGFAGLFDFVYVPTDYETRENYGYCVVNFLAPAAAMPGICAMLSSVTFETVDAEGKPISIEKTVEISAFKTQGTSALIEKYRNNGVMEQEEDIFKPALFQDGMRVDFPLPSNARSRATGRRGAGRGGRRRGAAQ